MRQIAGRSGRHGLGRHDLARERAHRDPEHIGCPRPDLLGHGTPADGSRCGIDRARLLQHGFDDATTVERSDVIAAMDRCRDGHESAVHQEQ